MSDVDVPFAVTFTHRLRHTSDVSDADFDVLTDLLASDPSTPAKVQLWVDSNLGAVAERGSDFTDRLGERLAGCASVELAGLPYSIPGGEACKNSPAILQGLLERIHEFDMDRRSYIIVAGGGAVLDVAGYAAAIAHRGIRLIRLPSTTLAQADSGIGVKNAINQFGKKNWIGTFAVPWAVINDAEILQTLPDRDFHSGLTEAIKVALLKDTSFFDWIEKNAASIRQRESQVSSEAIARSCRLHLDHITLGGDPFEALEARPLDFGHWSAHRLEPMTGYQLRHGEAVGIGVALDTLYSARVLGLDHDTALRVCDCIAAIGSPLWCDALSDREAVLKGLEEFRQHLGGRLTVTMLRDIGESVNVHEIDLPVMSECIEELRQIASASERRNH
ncbi:3-dehydroquinate synthase [Allorhodopirellula solitaria]|uniref:3-dehydroquinate synthase n=1 Tax=Allorhodopirellula solitaria TaxID=2527987 RepID=A0A5C5XY22_9BACT|nr:3-dehydroquinate synthase [Allorhodopirellula solitaria]TWT67459.1 3-dehydroquinate synthase [Allorhodopirellula solitaria]